MALLRPRAQHPILLLLAGLPLCSCVARAPLAAEEPGAEDRLGSHGLLVQPGEALGSLQARLDQAQAVLRDLPGYSAELVKEERVEGKLYVPQRMECKVRHEPFSVYLRFLDPPNLVGQEALYAPDRYQGKLIARAAGSAGMFGALAIDPSGSLAMRGNRYPIMETGMARLLERLVEFTGDGEALGELRVLEGAEVDGRPCVGFEAQPDPGRGFALVRAYFDQEWGLPVAYEAFEPGPPGEAPRLLERYTYESIDLGVVFDDEDFDRKNPEYGLR